MSAIDSWTCRRVTFISSNYTIDLVNLSVIRIKIPKANKFRVVIHRDGDKGVYYVCRGKSASNSGMRIL